MVRPEPFVLVDACHNPQSCENFINAVREAEPEREARPVLLVAALSDKDVRGILDVLVPEFPRIVVSATASDRALPAGELAQLVYGELDALNRPHTDVIAIYPSVREALDALTEAGEPVIAAGTITLAGEVAGLLR